jgi:hypothetical protein
MKIEDLGGSERIDKYDVAGKGHRDFELVNSNLGCSELEVSLRMPRFTQGYSVVANIPPTSSVHPGEALACR